VEPKSITKKHYQKALPKSITKKHYQKALPKSITKKHYQKALPKNITKKCRVFAPTFIAVDFAQLFLKVA
jgi:hypothetical protein